MFRFYHSLLLALLILLQSLVLWAANFDVSIKKATKAVRTPHQRIVSLSPVTTEFLFALGVGHRIVGVTTYCDRPTEAKRLTKVGGFADPQLEAIIKLRPTLVVATPFGKTHEVIGSLKAQGIKIVAHKGESLADARSLLLELGRATATSGKAASLQQKFDQDFFHLKSQFIFPHKRVLWLVGISPIVAASSTTFPGEILAQLGFINSLSSNTPPWPIVPMEVLHRDPPDLIVVSEGVSIKQQATQALLSYLRTHPKTKLVFPKSAILQRPGPFLLDDIRILMTSLMESDV